MRSLHSYSTTNQAKISRKGFLLKSLSVLSIFITTFGTIHAQEPSDLSTYVPYQNTYTYNYSKWYWHAAIVHTDGKFYECKINGDYERPNTTTDLRGNRIDNGHSLSIALEALYREKPYLYIGPGMAIGIMGGQFRGDIYTRARYELPMSMWISPKWDFLSLYATASAGFIYLSGEKANGCDYYIEYSKYHKKIEGFVGIANNCFGYWDNLARNAISGIFPMCDLGVGILLDFRYAYPNVVKIEKNSRYAIAVGYRVTPMAYVVHSLNLNNYKTEIDALRSSGDHIVIHFEQYY